MCRQPRPVVVLLFLLTFCSQSVVAATWKYEVTPYLWTAGMDGDIGPPGRTTSVDVSFSDYIGFIDAAFAFLFDARSDKWSFGTDFMWVKLSEDLDLPVTTLDAEVEQVLFEGWMGYRPDAWRDVRVVGGVRYLKSKTTIDFVGLPPNLKVEDSFADPFVGLEWRPRRGKWEFVLQGDIGGGVDADFMWGAIIGASYQFSERWSGKFAYRFLDVDFESDKLVFDMRLEGLGLGVGYKF